MLSVHMRAYFRFEHVRYTDVSVPAGSGRYTQCLDLPYLLDPIGLVPKIFYIEMTQGQEL